MIKQWMIAGLMVISLFTIQKSHASEPTLSEWPASMHVYLANMRNHPQQVIDTISDLLESEDRTLYQALYHTILSRTYSALLLPEKTLFHAEQGLAMVAADRHPWLYHNLAVAKAEALDMSGNPSEGKLLVMAAVDWARANQSMDLLTYAMSADGYLSLSLSATDDALAVFQQGYMLAQANNTLLKPADFASMIALVYEYQREPSLALPYFREAYDYYQANNIRLELANTIFGMGKANLDLGNREKGLLQLMQSADIALEISDLQGAAYSYQFMAQQLINEGKLDSAQSFLNDALRIFEDANNRHMQANVLLSLNDISNQQRRYTDSMALLDRAQSLAQGDAFLPLQIKINDNRAKLFADTNKFEEAYQLMVTNSALKSKLNRQNNSQRVLELKTKFEVEQQQAQNALLKEQNLRQQSQLRNEQQLQRDIFIVVCLLLIICLLLGFLYITGKRHQERLEKLANEDELTGLMTRRKTLEQLEHHLLLAQRHDTALSVAVLDLDLFKQINDTFGHQTGDAVLREFGMIARRTFRSTDVLGRVGGEEFLFFFPHTELVEAQTLLKRLSVAVRDIPSTLGLADLEVSVSTGLTMREGAQSAATIMASADDALYQAKAEGRDRIVSA